MAYGSVRNRRNRRNDGRVQRQRRPARAPARLPQPGAGGPGRVPLLLARCSSTAGRPIPAPARPDIRASPPRRRTAPARRATKNGRRRGSRRPSGRAQERSRERHRRDHRRQTPTRRSRRASRSARAAPCLSDRRLGLHLPRLSRAAAADPLRRDADQRGARLFATCWRSCCARPTPTTSRWSSTIPAARSATASTTSTRPTAREPPDDLIPQFKLVREATDAFGVCQHRGGGLRGRRSDRDLFARGGRGRRDRHHRLVRQGHDAARRATG